MWKSERKQIDGIESNLRVAGMNKCVVSLMDVKD